MDHNQRIILLHSLLNSIVSVRVENPERLPRTGGVLIVCNHSDLIDPVIQGLYSGRGLCYLAKAELLDARRNPLRRFERYLDRARDTGVPEFLLEMMGEVVEILGQLLRDARILPIVRGYRAGRAAGNLRYYEDVIANVVRLLQEGEAVAMYPEGGRSFDGKLKPFRGLAARIALQARVPVVPTALVGAYGFSDLNHWVSGSRRVRSIIYRIGEAIQPAEFPGEGPDPGKEAIKALTRRLQGDVADLLITRPVRLRPKTGRDGYYRDRPIELKTKSRKAGG